MAKTPKVVPDFSGGLVSFTDPRDLQDNQCQNVENLSVRYIGKLKQLGEFQDYSASITSMSATLEGGASPVNFTNGQNFFVFATDKKKDSTIAPESYIAFVDKATGKLWIHDATTKTWEHLKPYDTDGVSFNGGSVQGIYGQLAATMTGGGIDAVYYIADGGLRICDANFNNTTLEGPINMDWKGTWAHTTAYSIDDTVIFDTGTNNDDKQYIALSDHTSTDDDTAGTGRPVNGSGVVNSAWQLLENQKASTMHLSQITREFFNGAVSVNDWHCHPARCVPLSPYVNGVNSGSVSQGFYNQAGTAAKAVANGSIGFTLNLARNKGDGTILMQGRKFYATLTYDNSQESTPEEIGIITLADIKSLAAAPDVDELGYSTKLSKAAVYNDDNLHLINKVNDQDITSEFVPSDVKLDWDAAGQIKLVDNVGQTQVLSYTGFAVGSPGNNNLLTGANSVADTNASGGYKCTHVGAFTVYGTNGMIGMVAKNTTVDPEEYGTITASTANDFTCAVMSGDHGWEDTDNYRVEGVTLTGVSGWTDTGSCSISHAVTDGSVDITSSGKYSTGDLPITVEFSDPPGGATKDAEGSVIHTGTSPNIIVTGVNITDHGEGYTSAPSLTFSAGTGSTATGTCSITAELTLETTCINHGGTWTAPDPSILSSVEFDPPGEIQKDDERLGVRLTCSVEPKCQIATRGQIFDWNRGGNRVTKINIYTNKYLDDAGTIAESEDFAYMCSFDLESGYINEDGSYNAWTADAVETTQFNATSEFVGQMFDTNFQNRTGMFPDTWSTGMRFKTATIINRRVYAGNVMMKETGKNTEKIFPDRILKSLPNQFDNFTDYDILDVTVDDGDEIMALETFGGQLLQFKKGSMFVIDVTTQPEFIRASHKHRGIPNPYALAKTDFGVAFANAYGAFLYNGEIVSELTTNIVEAEWSALYDRATNDIIVGFHPEYKVLFFTDGTASNFLVYDMVARSWTKGVGTERLSAGAKSKFFVYANELTLAYATANAVDFYKWSENLAADLTNASGITWKSKEYDFGNPSTVKFVYKVYLTYKTIDTAAGVEMVAYHNDGTGVSTTTLTGTLGNTSGEWNTIELIPSPRISCKTIELQLQQIAATVVDSGFEVNDLIIIYREKSVR